MKSTRNVTWIFLCTAGIFVLGPGCCAPRVYDCGCGMGRQWSGRLTAQEAGCSTCESGVADGAPCLDCQDYGLITRLRHAMTCGSGCGEIYWGEWISDPPDSCDPCDDCGNWIGPQPRRRRFAGWRGQRLTAGCDCAEGSGPSLNPAYGGEHWEVIEGPQPTPALPATPRMQPQAKKSTAAPKPTWSRRTSFRLR